MIAGLGTMRHGSLTGTVRQAAGLRPSVASALAGTEEPGVAQDLISPSRVR